MIIDSFMFRFRGNKFRVKFLRKHGVTIGENCLIAGNVSIGSEPFLISIGNDVKISNGVSFVTHDGGIFVIRNYKKMYDADLYGKIKIGNNVFIGNKATIMPGVSIGNNCVIGYGSIVTRSIPDNSVAVGVPARVIEDIDTYYLKNIDRILNTKTLSPEEKKRVILDSSELKEFSNHAEKTCSNSCK